MLGQPYFVVGQNHVGGYSDESFGNPVAFYFTATDAYDWTSPQNADLWQDGVKTLFDPCPVGWRVPRSGKEELSPWDAFTSLLPPDKDLQTLTENLTGLGNAYALHKQPATRFQSYGGSFRPLP